MKWMHLSDLHLGKKVNEVSMVTDQEYILKQIIRIAKEESVDGILIAGDLYDKQIPSIEAVKLMDELLHDITDLQIPVCIISGNHDSAERLTFAADFLKRSKIYIADSYNGEVYHIDFEDELGPIHVYMLPYIKPVMVKKYHQEFEGNSSDEAMQEIMRHLIPKVNLDERNLFMCHQLVMGSLTCDSEEKSIGGLDQISPSVFKDFDYVALGHIHSPQNMGAPTIRYCGTPLAYSFSEAGQDKSVTIVDMKEKGKVTVREVMLTPRLKMRKIRGFYDEVTARDYYTNEAKGNPNDYLMVTLLDEEDVPEAIGKLRSIYPNIMQLMYDNQRTRSNQMIEAEEKEIQKTPMDYVEELYELQNNQPMSDEQRAFAVKVMEEIFED